MNELIRQIEAEQLKSDIPQFNVGDTVRVYAKVVEGSKERIQMFEGVVIKKQFFNRRFLRLISANNL